MLFKAFMPFISSFVNQLLPPACLFCAKLTGSSQSVCHGCYQDLPILSHHSGKHLTSPLPFTKIHALFAYQAPIVRLIAKLKFEQQFAPAAFLGATLAAKMKNEWYQHLPLPTLLLPVPLHRERLIERGYNQALEIARPIANTLNIPLDLNGVIRIKATAAQSGLNAKERQHNLKDAFLATKSYDGQFIAIIDDVLTTGSTVTALAHTLIKAGAERIDVIAAARTIISVIPETAAGGCPGTISPTQ